MTLGKMTSLHRNDSEFYSQVYSPLFLLTAPDQIRSLPVMTVQDFMMPNFVPSLPLASPYCLSLIFYLHQLLH